ncbi:hypothetical protein LCGC14_1416600 [marine sediment metagenome]|uniref:Uncharacterized protein n=1 Tax=marine sediment metagenome TaxID=412755 RepID=A0A0F9JSP4_9ZZZZ
MYNCQEVEILFSELHESTRENLAIEFGYESADELESDNNWEYINFATAIIHAKSCRAEKGKCPLC